MLLQNPELAATVGTSERGASLIEVMVSALILLIAGMGLSAMIEVGLTNNIRESTINNHIMANNAVLANGTATATDTVIVSVTASSGSSSQVPVSVAMSSLTGNADAIYQSE
jgi:Tfp pilus assembly protein PilV